MSPAVVLLLAFAPISVPASQETNRLLQEWANCFTKSALPRAVERTAATTIVEEAMARCENKQAKYERSLASDMIVGVSAQEARAAAKRDVLNTKSWLAQRQVAQIETLRAKVTRR
jgi:hypothetical protein